MRMKGMTAAASNPPPRAAKTSDAVALLKADHRAVEEIFEQYEQTDDETEKGDLVRKVCLDLIVHTCLEEEIFYPACRKRGVESETMDEAQVEHDGAKVLIADLLKGAPGDDYYDAKVKTLSEYIKHHVGEEEKPRSGIFAKARKTGLDMAGLGKELRARKMELMAQGEALSSSPPEPRSFVQRKPQKEYDMARYSNDYDDDRSYRGSGNYRERDEQGRFVSEDDDRRSYRGHGHGGWSGDPEGHARAAERGWEERGRYSRSRDYDEDDERRGYRSGGHGGWFGDPEGHSEASRRGWRDR